MDVTLLLCDAAQAVGGKLFVLGGGWTHIQTPNAPVNMALAVLLAVPWDQANDKQRIDAVLMTDDGDAVEIEGQPVMASGELEVGRPPGLKAGQALNAPLAFTFNGVVLPTGGYRWELHINDSITATAPFRVVG